jgi:hypothetical protein
MNNKFTAIKQLVNFEEQKEEFAKEISERTERINDVTEVKL